MRRSLAAALVLVSLVLPAWANFNIPNNVYRMKDFEKAKAAAQARGRAITFMYSNESTTCPLCANASMKAMRELKNRTEMVYVVTSDWKLLPGIVQNAMNTSEAGRYIPTTIIVHSAMTNVIAIVPYAEGDEMDKLLKQAVKRLPQAIVRRPAAAVNTLPVQTNSVVNIPVNENREIRLWRLFQSGTKVQASLVQEDGTSVVLKEEDGSKVTVAKYNLSKEDQDYIQDLKNKLASKATKSDKQ